MDTKNNEEAEMSLINDYTYQAMTDQRERDLARLVERNWNLRAALSGRESWWHRVLARRERRISIAAQRPAQSSAQSSAERGMATPQHRVAH
jgi:hypothetical protein